MNYSPSRVLVQRVLRTGGVNRSVWFASRLPEPEARSASLVPPVDSRGDRKESFLLASLYKIRGGTVMNFLTVCFVAGLNPNWDRSQIYI